MARAKRQSDILYNIRRRLNRRAASFERRAEKVGDAEALLLQEAARSARQEAQRYYMKNIETGDVGGAIRQGLEVTRKGDIGDQISAALERSEEFRRRVYAGTVSIWRGLDYHEREGAVLDFFGVSNLYELGVYLQEEIGVPLIDFGDSYDRYDEVQLLIQAHVMEIAWS